MQVQEMVALVIGWLAAGPAFVAGLRAAGMRYRVRPSLPVGPAIGLDTRPAKPAPEPLAVDLINPLRYPPTGIIPTRPTNPALLVGPLWWAAPDPSGTRAADGLSGD